MARRSRLLLKTGVWGVGLWPIAFLLWRAWAGSLTANPISFVTNTLGDWTLRILLASLAMTPLRILSGWSWPVSLRRLLGLFAFVLAALHFSVWIVLDHFFDWGTMGADIVKRPYITVGMLALTGLVPLAATSTAGAIRRLGARAWRRLHALVYAIGILAVLHYLWLAKKGVQDPYWYAMALALLLGVRLWDKARRLAARSRPPRLEPALAAKPSRDGHSPI